MVYLYGLGAAASAVTCEAYYRAHVGERWGLALWPGLVLALLTNFGIFGMLQHGSIITLAVVFSLITAVLRIAYTLAIGDAVSLGTWAAFGLVVAATVVKGLVK